MTILPEARQLRDTVRHLVVAHGALDDAIRPCGATFSLPHAHALLELLQHPEAMTISELASKLAIDRTNVSRLCARMEKEGQLARTNHPSDGRARAIHLTPLGQRLAQSVDIQSMNHFDQILQRLDGNVAELITSIERLTRAMRPTTDEVP